MMKENSQSRWSGDGRSQPCFYMYECVKIDEFQSIFAVKKSRSKDFGNDTKNEKQRQVDVG